MPDRIQSIRGRMNRSMVDVLEQRRLLSSEISLGLCWAPVLESTPVTVAEAASTDSGGDDVVISDEPAGEKKGKDKDKKEKHQDDSLSIEESDGAGVLDETLDETLDGELPTTVEPSEGEIDLPVIDVLPVEEDLEIVEPSLPEVPTDSTDLTPIDVPVVDSEPASDMTDEPAAQTPVATDDGSLDSPAGEGDIAPQRPVIRTPMLEMPRAGSPARGNPGRSFAVENRPAAERPTAKPQKVAEASEKQTTGQKSQVAAQDASPTKAQTTVQTPPSVPPAPVSLEAPQPSSASSSESVETIEQVADEEGQRLYVLPAGEFGFNPLIHAVLTFDIEPPVVRVQEYHAQPAAATVSGEAIAQDETPAVIQIVRDIDVAPIEPVEAAPVRPVPVQQPAEEAPIARAGVASSATVESRMTRNVILALAAGAAAIGTQWWRSHRRKLASLEQLCALLQFDPLAVWLDDPDRPPTDDSRGRGRSM